MAGIYIHIPFCKQACHYCNFHFSTSLRYKERLLKAMAEEISCRANYLPSGSKIHTLYLGGGTPSLLTLQDLNDIINKLKQYYNLDFVKEFTMECNPDNLSVNYLEGLQKMGVNRLSLGVQTFDDRLLQKLNRAHHAKEAKEAILKAQKTGFRNISIDLIYALPGGSMVQWKEDLAQAVAFGVNHLSCYCLTIEPQTTFGHWVARGRMKPIADEVAREQFYYGIEYLKQNGYVHYEISSYGKKKYFSLHNQNYWKQVPYLGIGPGAHSYDGTSRQYNIGNNKKYILSLAEKKVPCRKEQIDAIQCVNEFILTGIRTCWGIDLEKLYKKGDDLLKRCDKEVKIYQHRGWIHIDKKRLILTHEGKIFADTVALGLIIDNT